MSDLHVIVGLGATGLSCARYLHHQNIPFAITDTRADPPNINTLKELYPDVPLALGGLDTHLLEKAAKIVLSPGLALREPVIAEQIKRGIPVIGDIELFALATHQPVIAITGTNAKSTVTTLVGEMMCAAGWKAGVGGNLGLPALDLLQEQANVFVLELSSFQLETTSSLKPKVATILNITPDHMDRYRNLMEYQQAKQRVYRHCEIAVCNYDDPLTDYHDSDLSQKYYFTLKSPKKNQFGLMTMHGHTYLAFEDQRLLAIEELPVKGKHYQANALASLALGFSFGLSFNDMKKVLMSFKGLPHRCQFIRELNQVAWYNDSKGTNVGATIAAIEGLGADLTGKLILVAGGLGKHADFNLLVPAIEKYVRHVVLIGEAAKEIATAINKRVPVSFAMDMEAAVQQAARYAQAHDSVLLSPACASMDMFKNYVHRGEVFMAAVEKL